MARMALRSHPMFRKRAFGAVAGNFEFQMRGEFGPKASPLLRRQVRREDVAIRAPGHLQNH